MGSQWFKDIEWERLGIPHHKYTIPANPTTPYYHHSAQRPTAWASYEGKETQLILILFIAEKHYELFNLMISYLLSEIFNHLFIA